MSYRINVYFCFMGFWVKVYYKIRWFFCLFLLFWGRVEVCEGQDLTFFLEQTIRYNFSTRIAHLRVSQQQGLLQQQRSLFNWVGGLSAGISSAQIPLSAYDKEVLSLHQDLFRADGLYYQITGKKTFSAGQELLMSVGVQYQSFSYLPGNGYRGDIRFTLIQPLLQGAGKKGLYAGTIIQQSLLKSEENKFKAEVSFQIYRTAESYIRWATLRSQINAMLEAETRYEQLFSNIQELADAGKLKQSDTIPIKASLSNQKRKRLETEIKLNEIAVQLILNTGTNQAEIRPTPDIERITLVPINKITNRKQYLQFAEQNRFDLKTIEYQAIAYTKLLEQSKQLSLPKLDLTGSIGLTGQSFRYQDEPFAGKYLIQPLYASPIGPSFVAGISLSFPPQKDLAKGKQLEAQSLLEQTRLRNDYLKNSLEINISLQLKNIELSYQGWERAAETVSSYQKIIENEQIKLELGKSTILDLLYAHNILMEASIDKIQAKMNYLLSTLALRAECGMLVYFVNDEAVLYPKLLTGLPELPNE